MTIMTLNGAATFAPDPELSERDTLLDAEAMAGVLARAFGWKIERCARGRTKYRVGESLRVLYSVDHDLGGVNSTLVSIRAYPPGTGTTTASRPSPDRSLWLDEVGARAWVFPDDRKLRQLRSVIDDPWLARELTGAAVTSTELIAYAPEKSATLRCNGEDGPVAYLKLYADGADRRAAALYRELSPGLARRGVVAPSLMRHDRERGAVALAVVPGDRVCDASRPTDAWFALGESLAVFHRLNQPTALRRFPRTSNEWIVSSARLIGSARADLAYDTARLADRLLQTRVPSSVPTGLLHGDVHGKNAITLGGHRLAFDVGFVDLDQASIGDPAADIGSALASLRSDRSGTDVESAFLEGYAQLGHLPSNAELAWHRAASLLTERCLRAVNRVRLEGLARLGELVDDAFDTIREARA